MYTTAARHNARANCGGKAFSFDPDAGQYITPETGVSTTKRV
jgi:hypothetical protein